MEQVDNQKSERNGRLVDRGEVTGKNAMKNMSKIRTQRAATAIRRQHKQQHHPCDPAAGSKLYT